MGKLQIIIYPLTIAMIIIIIYTCILAQILAPTKNVQIEGFVTTWSQNKYTKMFLLRFLPIIGQHIFLKEYINEDVTWRMRILKDAIQTILPPTIAIVAFVISPEFLEAKYKFSIYGFFIVSLVSGGITFGFSMYDFYIHKEDYDNKIYEDEQQQLEDERKHKRYKKYKIFMYFIGFVDFLSGCVFIIPLYNMYGLKSAAFVIYTTSFGTLLIGIIWSLFQKNKHSYGYTIRTLLIGIISYYSTTDHLQMNETSITISLVSASITLSFAISELHKLNESFIFKLDRLELKNGCYYIPDKIIIRDKEFRQFEDRITQINSTGLTMTSSKV
ncbi:hypothetical protein C1646_811733 [Rhizophagus diaphanus]|nr:hypothetical protein C1646_811733 [Rhizophagus diaphanus] [Rhizophagus sp. MUCL 43196]